MKTVDEEKFKTSVVRGLAISPGAYQSNLEVGSIPEWDSLSHLNLISSVEEAFGVRFDTDTIPTLRTLPLLREALAKRLP